MKKLYKIDVGSDFVISKRLVNFLNPEYACVLLNSYDSLSDLKKISKYKLLEKENMQSFSSVSGEVSGLVNININNTLSKALFIKNDFKEKDTKFAVKSINSKLDLINLVKNTKLENNFKNIDAKVLIINSIIDEPLVNVESYLLKNLSDELIEIISILNKLYEFERIYVTLKNTENENISEYLSVTGTYPNMNIIALEDKYLIGRDEYLLNKINVLAKDSIILKPSQTLELRSLVKIGAFLCEKYINVVDVENKKVKIVKTKKNILASELLNKLKLLRDDKIYIKNGLLTGIIIDKSKEVITEDFNSLFVVTSEEDKQSKCINCGKCISVCPKGVNPIKMHKEGIIDSRCINCGLCSYFCPSNINLRGDIK